VAGRVRLRVRQLLLLPVTASTVRLSSTPSTVTGRDGPGGPAAAAAAAATLRL
jgi:hypothetical protein